MSKYEYVLSMELVKEKVRREYDGEIIERLTLKIKDGNMFPIFAKCTECYRSASGRGSIKLPMESFGSEDKRSVDIMVRIPDWEIDSKEKKIKTFQQYLSKSLMDVDEHFEKDDIKNKK